MGREIDFCRALMGHRTKQCAGLQFAEPKPAKQVYKLLFKFVHLHKH